MADIFDEINDDLRAERAQALLRRYGVLLAAVLVLVLVGVGGWQAWRWRQAGQGGQVAAVFLDAMRKATPAPAAVPSAAGLDPVTPARAEALAAFSDIAATAPEGYRTLARLRAAPLKIAAGDRAGGLALLDQVSADTAADPLLRGLADLLWVQAEVDAGDPAAVEGRLAGLLVAGNAWRALAMESQAWLFMRTGREAQARDVLKQLQADANVPEGVRGRAGWLLTRLGEAPATPPMTPSATPAGTGG